MKWKLFNTVRLYVTPWVEFSRQEYWSGFPSPGSLPNWGFEPRSSSVQADYLSSEPSEKPKNTEVVSLSLLQEIFTHDDLWSPALQADSLPAELPGKPEVLWCVSKWFLFDCWKLDRSFLQGSLKATGQIHEDKFQNIVGAFHDSISLGFLSLRLIQIETPAILQLQLRFSYSATSSYSCFCS